jgi:hypothetical protein
MWRILKWKDWGRAQRQTVVGFYKELLTAKIPRERVDGMKNRVGFPFVGVPFLSMLGESLRTERDWLMFDRSIRIG